MHRRGRIYPCEEASFYVDGNGKAFRSERSSETKRERKSEEGKGRDHFLFTGGNSHSRSSSSQSALLINHGNLDL
jgi:hypothetical protein